MAAPQLRGSEESLEHAGADGLLLHPLLDLDLRAGDVRGPPPLLPTLLNNSSSALFLFLFLSSRVENELNMLLQIEQIPIPPPPPPPPPKEVDFNGRCKGEQTRVPSGQSNTKPYTLFLYLFVHFIMLFALGLFLANRSAGPPQRLPLLQMAAPLLLARSTCDLLVKLNFKHSASYSVYGTLWTCLPSF